MISYAGVSLCAPERAALAEVSADLDWDRLLDFERDLRPGSATLTWSHSGALRDRPRKLQTLYWPRGASRWARGYFLATDAQLEQIRQAVYGGPDGYRAATLKLTDGTGRAVETDLWMLPPRPCHQIPGQKQLWILTLVDDRYYWWQESAAVSVSEGSTTWSELYAAVGSALGVDITVDPDIPDEYLTPARPLAADNESLPLLLDTVAYQTGRRIVRLLDGTVLAQDYDAAATSVRLELLKPDRRKVVGGLFAFTSRADLNALVPTSVTVHFPRSEAGVLTGSSFEEVVTLAELALPEFQNVQGNGRTKRENYPYAATFGEGDADPSNADDLAALARQWAKDWYRLQLGAVAALWAGVPAWKPDALHDHLLWTHDADILSCRVERGPWDDPADRLPAPDSTAGGGTGFVVVEDITSVCDTLVVGKSYFNWYNAQLYVYLGNCTFFDVCACDVISPPSGSGGGGGGGGGDCNPISCPGCNDDTPVTWSFTASGFTGKCGVFNGDWVLEQIGACRWRQKKTTGARADAYIIEGVFYLAFEYFVFMGDVFFGANYSLDPFGGDCCSDVEVAYDQGDCDAQPATVTLTPDCCGGGGGGSIVTDCCPGVLLPATVTAAFSNATGTCTCLNGASVALTALAPGSWQGNAALCSGPATTVVLYCSGGQFHLSITSADPGACAAFFAGAPTSAACSPLSLIWSAVTVMGCCAGTVRVTITG